jgi:RNA polymerase sigma-70 factor (ECF subfamily)
MLDLEGMAHNNPIGIVASCQMQQHAGNVQRDVYESHRHRVFALAFYMTGNELEAEGILTKTFIQAFSAAEKPQPEHIDSLLLGELRQRFSLGPDEPSSTPLVRGEVNLNSHLASHNVRRTDLEEAIRILPPTERLVFLLRDVEGYSPAEISQLIEIPESQIQRILFSARIRLRRELAMVRADRREAA